MDEQSAVETIEVATEILTESKNMLTLTKEEYAALSGVPYADNNPAVIASADSFVEQLNYAEQRILNAVTFLKQQAIARLKED